MDFGSNPEFNELSFYTLSHPDIKYFIHQHIVDAFQAQVADGESRPVGIVFSLLGLYLFIEKGFSGRQIQRAHMDLSKFKDQLPDIPLPEKRGNITVTDVLNSDPGEERDRMIRKWCESVWEAYETSQPVIRAFVGNYL